MELKSQETEKNNNWFQLISQAKEISQQTIQKNLAQKVYKKQSKRKN